jgi:hypothetical protein
MGSFQSKTSSASHDASPLLSDSSLEDHAKDGMLYREVVLVSEDDDGDDDGSDLANSESRSPPFAERVVVPPIIVGVSSEDVASRLAEFLWRLTDEYPSRKGLSTVMWRHGNTDDASLDLFEGGAWKRDVRWDPHHRFVDENERPGAWRRPLLQR